ncbi:MAG: hypothetical protein SF162_13210 [bacterium]|nr:hypothetical protein [bacterium]
MPYTVFEFVPGHVLYLAAWGELTLSELEASNAEGEAVLNRSPHEIHYIADLRRLSAISIASIHINEGARTISGFAHPKHGWQFILSGNTLIRFAATAIAHNAMPTAEKTLRIAVTNDPDDVRARLIKLLPDGIAVPPMPDIETIILQGVR